MIKGIELNGHPASATMSGSKPNISRATAKLYQGFKFSTKPPVYITHDLTMRMQRNSFKDIDVDFLRWDRSYPACWRWIKTPLKLCLFRFFKYLSLEGHSALCTTRRPQKGFRKPRSIMFRSADSARVDLVRRESAWDISRTNETTSVCELTSNRWDRFTEATQNSTRDWRCSISHFCCCRVDSRANLHLNWCIFCCRNIWWFAHILDSSNSEVLPERWR